MYVIFLFHFHLSNNLWAYLRFFVLLFPIKVTQPYMIICIPGCLRNSVMPCDMKLDQHWLRQFPKNVLMNIINKMRTVITFSKLLPHRSGANELRIWTNIVDTNVSICSSHYGKRVKSVYTPITATCANILHLSFLWTAVTAASYRSTFISLVRDSEYPKKLTALYSIWQCSDWYRSQGPVSKMFFSIII